MPRLAIWTPNGGTDPRTRLCTPRKFRGAGAEVAIHFDNIRAMRPDIMWFHLLFGTRNQLDMEADSYPMALYGARELDHLTNLEECVGAMLSLWEYGQFYGLREMWFYEGQFRASPYLQTAWDHGRLDQVEQRIVTSMKPYTALAKRGVPVRVFFDAIANKPAGSLDQFGLNFVKDGMNMPVGIETRPHLVAEWANRTDIPCVTECGYWYRADPEKYEDSQYAIPNGKLKGEQFVICGGGEDVEAARAAAQQAWDEGKSVAFNPGMGTWVPKGRGV
jgi:hypothetical protein